MRKLSYYNIIKNSFLDDEIKETLVKSYVNLNEIKKITSLYSNYLNTIEEINKFTTFDYYFYSTQEVNINTAISKLNLLEENKSSISIWSDLNKVSLKLKELGLEQIIQKVEEDNLDRNLILSIFKYNFYNTLAKEIFQKYDLLQVFNRISYEESIRNFINLDENIIINNKNKVASELSGKRIPNGRYSNIKGDLTELYLIENELSKKKRHISVRQLIDRAPNALQVIKPCFMMSPLSVSQYLPANKIKFDVLVVDEASQLRPEEALNSIARCSQVVIVGDPKQLPPTSFFDTVNEFEEDETVMSESESILDMCLNVYKPISQLKWHYRSQHESLISFSNTQFYDSSLVIFPSPTGAHNDELGIKYNYIENGYFQQRRNKVEARIVVEKAIQQMKEFPDNSIGIGTFNAEQRDLIQDLMDEKEKNNTTVASYINKWNETSEPFFVKNLENLQGDERDVIMISTTYGKDVDTKKVYQRFGPINSDVGWRRLNVMFTRSKQCKNRAEPDTDVGVRPDAKTEFNRTVKRS